MNPFIRQEGKRRNERQTKTNRYQEQAKLPEVVVLWSLVVRVGFWEFTARLEELLSPSKFGALAVVLLGGVEHVRHVYFYPSDS